MDQNPVNSTIKYSNPNTVEPPNQINGKFKKKHSAVHFLKVALFALRRRSVKQKTLAVEKGSSNVWRRLVGSMRPLHLQSNPSPPLALENSKLPEVVAVPPISEKINEIHSDEASAISALAGDECESQDSHSVHDETESRYASALALNELVDQSEENEQEDSEVGYVDEDGDVMIDAKAEEFIAQFYEQMRLQYVEMDH